MIGRLKSELKIAGSNLYLISAVFVVAFIFLAWFGGDLLNLSILGFEVIFPFFTAIAVGVRSCFCQRPLDRPNSENSR